MLYRWITVFVFLITIFAFSAHHNIPLTPYRDRIFNKIRPLETYIYNNFDFVVKKIVHFGEYALLTLLLFYAVRGTSKIKSKYLWTFALGVLYAISDEVHQIFVPTRHARVFDVMVDTAGVLFMLTILRVVKITREH